VGMVPSEHSSSEQQRRGGITKAGSSRLRWLMTQAAWCAWRSRPSDPMVLWAKQVAYRRGTRVAITALGRKMLGILWAIWRSGKRYDPAMGARVTSSLPTLDEGLAMLTTV
jgi:transposase